MILFIYDETVPIHMVRGKVTDEEKEVQKNQQKMRAKMSRASRRSGKITKKEGKVDKSKENCNSKKITLLKRCSF